MPKQQTDSSKTTKRKTGGKALDAQAASPATPVQRGMRKAPRTEVLGEKRPSRTSGEDIPFLASKVTARSQTTLPSGVRKALGLRAGDRIAYRIEKEQVVIRKVTKEEEDPALDGFLDLLGEDIAGNKGRVVFATEGFADYLEELTAGIEVDYDAPIEGDFQL